MRRLAVAACAAAVLAGLTPAANAFPPNATDRGCSLVTASDASTGNPHAQFGYLFGGPIRQNGTLLCTAKVGVSTHSGSYLEGGSGSATGTNGVTQLLPSPVAFDASPEVPVYVCSQFTDPGGVTYYWDDWNDAWTTVYSGAACELAISWGIDDPIFDPVFDLLESADWLVCDTLKVLHPFFYPSDPLYVAADGDLYVLGLLAWDCPPFSNGSSLSARGYLHVFTT